MLNVLEGSQESSRTRRWRPQQGRSPDGTAAEHPSVVVSQCMQDRDSLWHSPVQRIGKRELTWIADIDWELSLTFFSRTFFQVLANFIEYF